jgi:hypothetical protein
VDASSSHVSPIVTTSRDNIAVGGSSYPEGLTGNHSSGSRDINLQNSIRIAAKLPKQTPEFPHTLNWLAETVD